MKKHTVLMGILLLLFFIFFIILLLNFSFFLNHPFFKEKFINYLRFTYNSTLTYREAKLEPLKKRLVLRDFSLEGPQGSLSFSKGIVGISFSKLLRLNFFPSKLYFKDFNLKLPLSKEEVKEKKPFNLENTLNYLYSLGPLSISIKGGTIEKETLYGPFKLSFLKGETQVNKNQMDFKIQGSFSLNLKTKGRSYENGIKEIKGKLEISGLAKEEKVLLDISPLEINYPKVNGRWELKKDSEGYSVSLSLNRVDLGELKRTLSIFWAQDPTFKYLNEIIQGGVASNLTLKSSGKDLKELTSLSNLSLETQLEKGELELKKISLSLREIEGALSLKKAFLTFEGKALVNEKIPFQIESLSLDLKRDPLELSLKTSFESEAKILIDTASPIVKSLEVLKDYEVEGEIKGDLEIKGSLTHLEPSLNLYFHEVKMKTPFYLKPLVIRSGILSYQPSLVDFKDWKLAWEDSWVESLEGNWSIKNSFLNLEAKRIWLSESFIEEHLKKKSPSIDEIVSKYNLQTKGIFLDWLSYKGPFFLEDLKENPQVLLKNLFFKGSLVSFNLELPYKKERFRLESPNLGFTYEKGKTILENSLVYVDKIPFEVKGVYEKDFWSLKVKGDIEENLKSKILKVLEWREDLIFKGPVILNNLELEGQQESIVFKGESLIFGKVLSFKGNYGGPNYILESRFQGERSDLKWLLFKRERDYEIEVDGILELGEIKPLLLRERSLLEGRVKTQLYLSLSERDLERIKENLESQNFKELIQTYLLSEFFPKTGLIEVENLKYLERENSLELSSQVIIYPSEIQLEDVSFKWNTFSLKGKVNLIKEGDFLNLRGFLESQRLDLKKEIGAKLEPKKEKTFPWEEILGLPLIIDLELGLKDVVLPTAHQIFEFRTHLSFTSEKVLTLKIPVLNVCGLKIEGFYERTPELQYLFLELLPSAGDFLDFFSCLYPEEMPKIILEGPFKTKGFFYTDGKKGILEDTYGELEVISERGYIYRAPLIARVLGFLSPIDIFRGKVPNLENNLLEYEELKLVGYFGDTSFKVDTGFLSALGFRLFSSGSLSFLDKKTNLTFYVSPFKTVDTLIEKIPLLSKRLLGKPRMLIFVPLQVVGTYDNPVIVPLHPSSIGKGIFTFFFRFLGIEEEFYKPSQIPEKLKKMEIFKEKVGNNLRR
ncbi:MAG: hypothetical protein NZ530_04205 [Thermodesulfobacteriaceae bacterium]|nr:hypothetical protein [Thermodesulfobacteriaceae bacterium]